MALQLRLLLLLVVLLVGPPVAAWADDFMILPGQRVGDVSLSMPIEEILRLLGSPSRVDSATGMYQWQGRQITVYQNLNTGQIGDIRTYWVFRRPNPYRTEKDVRIGASLEQIRQAYGDAGCFVNEGTTWRTYAWRELGVFFTVWTSPDLPVEITNKIAEIGVRRPTRTAPGPGLKPCW